MSVIIKSIRPSSPRNPHLLLESPFTGEFDIALDEVITRVTPRVNEGIRLITSGQISQQTRNFEVIKSQERFLYWLRALEVNNEAIVSWDIRYSVFDYLFISDVIRSGAYVCARCAQCVKGYSPSETRLHRWEDPDGDGGLRLLCPMSHVLVKTIDWCSA
jgi:hypothetical protein